MAHEADVAVVHLARGGAVQAGEEVVLTKAVALELIEGEVDAVPLLDVLADVAQDVGELVGRAQAQRGAVHGLEAALRRGGGAFSSRARTA